MISPEYAMPHFIDIEGEIPHFYLDGVKVVSIGIGVAIETKEEAAGLILIRKKDYISATIQEKIEEWQKFKVLKEAPPISYCNSISALVMRPAEIKLLFIRNFQNFLLAVKDQLCDLNEYPDVAQLVLMDFVFNLGISGVKTKFPNFLHYFLAHDYTGCLRESERTAGGKLLVKRNKWTSDQLTSLIGAKV